jgi:Lrp/AsnC family transcriptional regulator for asnA, asnC and gidA
MGMDEIDRKIVAMLQEDGRKSLTEIGQKLGLSHVAVRKRLAGMCERGHVRVSAGLSGERLGLQLAIVNAEVETPERLAEFVRVFSMCPRSIFVTRTTGAYNLMTIMIAEDTETLRAILEACCVRAWKGVRRSEVTVAEAPRYPEHLPIRIVAERGDSTAPCGINCGKCSRYTEGRCLACPATKYYRGPL